MWYLILRQLLKNFLMDYFIAERVLIVEKDCFWTLLNNMILNIPKSSKLAAIKKIDPV